MAADKKGPSRRLAFIDWTRGVAALIMLQGHTFHSFTKPDLRNGGPYEFSQFLGGLPPAIFLFLTGITLAFLMDGRERKGFSGGQRVVAALRRAGYLLLLAFLFRFQMWVFAWPSSPWTDLLRVDILNSMGLAVALLSVLALLRTADRVRLCAVLGLAIAAVSPVVSQINWGSLPVFMTNYIAPSYAYFGFFPWAAYVAFGMSAGSIVRLVRNEGLSRAILWATLLGSGLLLIGLVSSSLPFSVYEHSEFWLNSPWQILMKLGAILLLLAFAFLWTEHGAGTGWSWIQQFGTTSLLVYWVHIELVYGRWLWFWKRRLDNLEVVAASIGVICLMLALAVAKTNWRSWGGVRVLNGYRRLSLAGYRLTR